MITGLFHASYTISDVEKSIKFFGETLGIENTRWQVSDQDYLSGVTGIPGISLRIGFASIEGDATVFELVEVVRPKGNPVKTGFGIIGSPHHTWETDNLPALIKRLKEAGVKFLEDPAPLQDGIWGDGMGTFFRDPDGLLYELIEFGNKGQGKGRLTRLHHTSLTVSNIDKALELLCGKLQLKLEKIVESDGNYIRHFSGLKDTRLKMAYLHNPGTDFMLELWEFKNPVGEKADMTNNNLGSAHLCYRVNDIREEYAALREIGIKFVGVPTEITAGVNKGAFATYFMGPDDIRFELFQKPIVL